MNNTNLICIIDDDPIYLFTIKKLIKISNLTWHYIIFKNGLDAINGLSNRVKNNEVLPDIILLDINMPIMDGWEFLKQYKTINIKKNIPIYITSSSINQDDICRANQNNLVKRYINKPLKKESLFSIEKDFLT